MIIISADDVRKLAQISAIQISENEIESLTQELRAVLAYASSLQNVPDAIADGAIADGSVCQGSQLFSTINVVRPDLTESYNAEVLLERAPEREGNFFVVPVIVK